MTTVALYAITGFSLGLYQRTGDRWFIVVALIAIAGIAGTMT